MHLPFEFIMPGHSKNGRKAYSVTPGRPSASTSGVTNLRISFSGMGISVGRFMTLA